MTENDMIRAARRELLRNIALAPFVLLVRVPIALLGIICGKVHDALFRLSDWMPGWTCDYQVRMAFRKDTP